MSVFNHSLRILANRNRYQPNEADTIQSNPIPIFKEHQLFFFSTSEILFAFDCSVNKPYLGTISFIVDVVSALVYGNQKYLKNPVQQ